MGIWPILLATAMGMAGCKPAVEISRTNYIIGKNNIKRVTPKEITTTNQAALDASALLITAQEDGSVRICSAVLLKKEGDERTILTNHHCFARSAESGLASEELIPGACENTQ